MQFCDIWTDCFIDPKQWVQNEEDCCYPVHDQMTGGFRKNQITRNKSE